MTQYVACRMCNSPVFCMGRGLCTTGSQLKELPRMKKPKVCFSCIDETMCIGDGECHYTKAALADLDARCGNGDYVIVNSGNVGVAGASAVDHPAHYGGADDPFEAIKVIDAWDLGFTLGNAIKYIKRAGQKNQATRKEDLQKAIWYLNHELEKLK